MSRKEIVQVMSQRVKRDLSFSKKLLLVATGLLAAAPIIIGLINATQSQAEAQTGNAAALTSVFETASIKQNKGDSGDVHNVRIAFTFDGTTFSGTDITLLMLVQRAYGVETQQISGAPGWLYLERYDIEARVNESVAAEIDKLSEDQRMLAHQHMFQVLLADRFKLAVHRENTEIPGYALVVAKNGPRLHEAKPGDTYPDGIKSPDGLPEGPHAMLVEGREVAGQALPMAALASMLYGPMGRPVLDKTGLSGSYDFALRWTAEVSPSPASNGVDGDQRGTSNPPSTSPEVSIFTAIQEQLGLELQSQPIQQENVVIDHVERPTDK